MSGWRRIFVAFSVIGTMALGSILGASPAQASVQSDCARYSGQKLYGYRLGTMDVSRPNVKGVYIKVRSIKKGPTLRTLCVDAYRASSVKSGGTPFRIESRASGRMAAATLWTGTRTTMALRTSVGHRVSIWIGERPNWTNMWLTAYRTSDIKVWR